MGTERIGQAVIGPGRIAQALVNRNNTPGSDSPARVVALAGRQDRLAYSHMLLFDSKFPGVVRNVGVTEGHLEFEGREIQVLDSANIPPTPDWSWSEVGADVVIEATGRGKGGSVNGLAQVHLEHGAKAVIITCPTKDATPHYVVGVNHQKYNGEQVISAGSCTTNASAPIIRAVIDELGSEIATISGLTIHTTTRSNDQNIDLPSQTPRKARSALRNIIPTTTGAATAVKKVIPEIEDLQIPFDFVSRRIPLQDVSSVDVTFTLRQRNGLTSGDVLEILREAAGGKMKGILGIAPEHSVSSMFAGNPNAVIVTPDDVQVTNGQIIRVFGWYDNEYGFVGQVNRATQMIFGQL